MLLFGRGFFFFFLSLGTNSILLQTHWASVSLKSCPVWSVFVYVLTACAFVTRDTVRHPRRFVFGKFVRKPNCSWSEAFVNRGLTVSRKKHNFIDRNTAMGNALDPPRSNFALNFKTLPTKLTCFEIPLMSFSLQKSQDDNRRSHLQDNLWKQLVHSRLVCLDHYLDLRLQVIHHWKH